jgi:hypothetical protein
MKARQFTDEQIVSILQESAGYGFYSVAAWASR